MQSTAARQNPRGLHSLSWFIYTLFISPAWNLSGLLNSNVRLKAYFFGHKFQRFSGLFKFKAVYQGFQFTKIVANTGWAQQ